MTLPSAVYRLQFRDGMDFDRAAALAPYLAGLGVSHLYASPLFTATPGSSHGYDIIDPTEIEPAIGGRAGLERLSAALKAEGLGLILDIVPNHMAFAPQTPWLRDVLRHGATSRYADHFDLDLGSERLRLPWLPAPFESILGEDGFAVGDDPDGAVLVADALRVPLAATPSLEPARGGRLQALRALHAEQPWRLTHWRTETDAISHRRFFSVTGLIGVRVERAAVFADTHALLFELVEAGIVDGVRIDHIDGLSDPAAYLDRLRARLPDTPIWVEKILSGPETLPRAWPVQGTTGYVAARAFSRLLTDADGLERLEAAYRSATGRTDPLEDVLHRARHQVMKHDLAAELWTLQTQLAEIAARDVRAVEFGPETLRTALLEMIAVFPRYRTYATERAMAREDAALIAKTAARAEARQTHPGAIAFLADVLTRTTPETARFRLRFQQVTGAALAKSTEDTAFFREVTLLSANEVGGEPGDDPLGVAGFHRAMQRRAERMPHGLTLTSSHDTKRSEDARMRIAAITRAPDAFEAWFRICAGFAPPRLDRNLVWYVAQTFLALEPGDGDLGDRLADHVVKALREAKSETFWTAPDLALEEAAQGYARRLARHFPRHAGEVTPILAEAERLSLAQTALKLTVPGIPDIYQGCELPNHALTDPDNRRPVDFGARAALLVDPAQAGSAFARDKFLLIRRLLDLRRDRPALFLEGLYAPAEAPPAVCAFARHCAGESLHVAIALVGSVPRGLPKEGARVWPPERAAGTAIRITLCA